MKTIVVVKPARGIPRRQLAHCYKAIGRMGPEVPSITGEDDRVVAIINGLEYGAVIREASPDAKALTADMPKGRVPLRHVVISIDDTKDPYLRAEAFRALPALCSQFVAKFAPQSPYIGIVHQDRQHPHCHILIANDNEHNLAIHWDRDDLKEMQSMTWVSPETTKEFNIESGRHNGLSRRYGTGTPYPLALGLAALQTIGDLTDYDNTTNPPDVFTSSPFKGAKTSKPIKARRVSQRTIRNLTDIVNPQPRIAPSLGTHQSPKWQNARQFSQRRIPSPPDLGR
jgi:hypothetical protein